MFAAVAIVVLAAMIVIALGYPVRAVPDQSGRALQGGCSATMKQAPGFRLGIYNIHRGKGLDGKRSLARIAENLHGVDIACLHEVAGAVPGLRRNQAEDLAEALDLGWLFFPTKRRWFKHSAGNALLSRLSVGPWRTEALRETVPGFRNLTVAELLVDGEPIPLITGHLARNADRAGQLHQLFDHCRHSKRFIIAGDLNTRREDPIIQNLLDEYQATDALSAGLGAQAVSHYIDWIIIKGFTTLSAAAVENGASDHPCLWVDLSLEMQQPSP